MGDESNSYFSSPTLFFILTVLKNPALINTMRKGTEVIYMGIKLLPVKDENGLRGFHTTRKLSLKEREMICMWLEDEGFAEPENFN